MSERQRAGTDGLWTRRRLLGALGGLVVGGGLGGALLVDPGTGGVRAVADSGELAGPKAPKVMDCEAWGAREPSSPVKEYDNKADKVIVHHTATANRTPPLELPVLARAIQEFHMDTNGWIDSGHHFLINRAGLIAEGRHRSLEALLDGHHMIEGAHCPGQNTTAVGIENEGTYSEVDPPGAQLATLKVLCAFACLQYGIAPNQLYGHRDYKDTACPGDRLYALLPSLRSGVAALLAKPGTKALPVTSPATWPLLRIADRGPHVLAAQHLMRNAGVAGVPADGQFGRTTADGVFAFQRAHGLELSGMIGGASWPLLAVPVRMGQGGEGEAAVRALLSTRQGATDFAMPQTVQAATWQRLLGTG
jgi:hypothetical protein